MLLSARRPDYLCPFLLSTLLTHILDAIGDEHVIELALAAEVPALLCRCSNLKACWVLPGQPALCLEAPVLA